MNFKELTENLRKPIQYQWRVQSRTRDRSKAICTAYIDARDVMNTLDQYCENGWAVEYKEVAGFIFCGIGIRDDQSNTIWKWDCGQRIESNPDDQMFEQAGKSASSDALKRSAVMWGIGRFLYDLDMVTLPCDSNGNVVDANGQRVWDLTSHINNRGSIKSSAGVSNVPPELPSLDQDKYDMMVKYITEGKVKEVETAIKKYKLNDSQKKLLTTLINQEKSRQITASAKK